MNGGRMTGRMEDYYSYMAVRAVKFGQDPGDLSKWPEAAVKLMGVFNAWRRRPEITALTDGQFLPVYLGQGWDTTEWASGKARMCGCGRTPRAAPRSSSRPRPEHPR
jgi:hypothetical protein